MEHRIGTNLAFSFAKRDVHFVGTKRDQKEIQLPATLEDLLL